MEENWSRIKNLSKRYHDKSKNVWNVYWLGAPKMRDQTLDHLTRPPLICFTKIELAPKQNPFQSHKSVTQLHSNPQLSIWGLECTTRFTMLKWHLDGSHMTCPWQNFHWNPMLAPSGCHFEFRPLLDGSLSNQMNFKLLKNASLSSHPALTSNSKCPCCVCYCLLNFKKISRSMQLKIINRKNRLLVTDNMVWVWERNGCNFKTSRKISDSLSRIHRMM